MIPLDKLTKMVRSKDLRTRDIVLRAWKVDLMSRNNRFYYDLVLDDSGFEKIFGNFGDREREVSAKTEVCSAFIDMYSHIVTGCADIEMFNKASVRCCSVLSLFGPIVKSFPRAFLCPEQIMNFAWDNRRA